MKNGEVKGTATLARPDEVLTRDEVAAWLKVRPRQLGRLGVPALRLGAKTVRYLRSDVLAWLEGQRSAHRLTSRPTPGNGE